MSPPPPKYRQPRLRASCDGCFLAKVKCSKTRPVCSRCLSCGLVCNYSPSSRAGKPKLENGNDLQSSPAHDVQAPAPFRDEHAVPYSNQIIHDGVLSQDRGWVTPSPGMDNNMNIHHSLATGISLHDYNNYNNHNNYTYEMGILTGSEPMLRSSDSYTDSAPWEVPPETRWRPMPNISTIAQIPGPQTAQPPSFDAPGSSVAAAWGEHTSEMASYSQPQSSPSYLPSPTEAPGILHQIISKNEDAIGACTTACCQALVTLHHASTLIPVSVDAVLAAARQVIDACLKAEANATIYFSGGIFTIAMLLATIIGKVGSIHEAITQTCYESGSIMQAPEDSSGAVAGGVDMESYHLTAGIGNSPYTLPQLGYLSGELRKLRHLFQTFCNLCPELTHHTNLSSALGTYIASTVDSTRPKFDSARSNLDPASFGVEPSTRNMASEGDTGSPFQP